MKKLGARLGMGMLWASAPGCFDVKPCNDELQDGATFTAALLSTVDSAVVERPWYIEEGTPSCGDLDVVELSSSQVVTLEKPDVRGRNACYTFICPTNFPSPAVKSTAEINGYGDGSVCSNGRSKLAITSNCEVQRYVALERRPGADSIYGSADTDGTGSVTLVRALMITPDLPCTEAPVDFPNAFEANRYFCYDRWNVQLTPSKKK